MQKAILPKENQMLNETKLVKKNHVMSWLSDLTNKNFTSVTWLGVLIISGIIHQSLQIITNKYHILMRHLTYVRDNAQLGVHYRELVDNWYEASDAKSEIAIEGRTNFSTKVEYELV